MAVDIGAEAINRTANVVELRTSINKENPASIAGVITSIDIWAWSDIAGLRVGTFYTTNGFRLKCRDSEAIPGTITGGSKVTKIVSITVEIGDYIGCYYTSGRIEKDVSGLAGLWDIEGEYIDPGDETDYAWRVGEGMSLGGYIEVVAVGRSFGFIIG